MSSVLRRNVKRNSCFEKQCRGFVINSQGDLGLVAGGGGGGQERLVFLFLAFKINVQKNQRTQINNIRHKRGDITIEAMNNKRIIKKYCEQLYAYKFDNIV